MHELVFKAKLWYVFYFLRSWLTLLTSLCVFSGLLTDSFFRHPLL